MNEKVKVYGFGSYFRGHPDYRDVDILLIHQSSNPESCRFAIQCKRFLVSNFSVADVTILSHHEEQQISFLERSGALQIGEIHLQRKESGLSEMLAKIDGCRNQSVATYRDADKT